MSSENTITIPAGLNGDWTAEGLRKYADFMVRPDALTPYTAAEVLRFLADEIERQAPRPEGWYHVKDGAWERVLWWDGDEFAVRPGDYGFGVTVPVPHDATITPVTIGRAES